MKITAPVCCSAWFLLVTLTFTQEGVKHYYVSSTGDDRNVGSQAKPWRTLQHAADSLDVGSAGTIVHVAPGNYSSMSYCSVDDLVKSNAFICMQKSGTASQPIIFQSDNPLQAKLQCDSAGGMILLIASYVQVKGFDISCPKEGSFAGATYGNNSHNQFLNNYLHDFDVTGCTSVGVLNGNISAKPSWNNIGHHVASGNTIRHAGATTNSQPQCNQEHGLYFSDPYDMLTNNVISGMIGLGIHSYGGGICHQIISNNTVFDNSQGGVVIENVAKNDGYWDECKNGGVSDYNTVTNNIVVNNGIGRSYNGANGGIDGRGLKGGGHNLFSNNLISSNHPQQAALTSPDSSVNEKVESGTSVFTNYQPDRNWQPAADFDCRNYAPNPGGSAVDGGTPNCAPGVSNCAPATDIVGTSRPQGRAYDIGAFEVVPQSSNSQNSAPAKHAPPK